MATGKTSTERYNPITGAPITVQPSRPNTSAIFGGSPGAIEYMFIPPSATTRPTVPNTTEKRRSLSRESLRRSLTTPPESIPDSDECSSISDVSECGNEVEHRERTRNNSGTFTKTRKPITRSVSSRLPVAASRPTVMKRANSFTRGTDSCVPRVQSRDSRGSTSQQEASQTSDPSTQPRISNAGGGSKIPRKAIPRGTGSQSSRIPLKRADVNLNVSERPGKEIPVVKKTAPADSKSSRTASNASSKQTSEEQYDPVVPKPNVTSGIPVKSGKGQQLHPGNSRIPSIKQDGGDPRTSASNKTTEQNIDKENERATYAGKSTSKREGTGDELRVGKSDVTKSKLPRKSNIPKMTAPKSSQRNNSNAQVEIQPSKTGQIKNKTTLVSDQKISIPNVQKGAVSGSPEIVSATLNTLQRSDSGFGDTDSVGSKEDTPVTEPGSEFIFSRENSKSKIPRITSKSRMATKPSREAPSRDGKKPEIETIKVGKLETDKSALDDENSLVFNNETSMDVPEDKTDEVEHFNDKLKTEESQVLSEENLVRGLESNDDDVVASHTESRSSLNKDVENETPKCDEIGDGITLQKSEDVNAAGIISNDESPGSMLKSENNDSAFSENESKTRKATKEKESLENLRANDEVSLTNAKAELEPYKQPIVPRKAKQSPKKPPRLSKLLAQNDSENKLDLAIAETRRENGGVLLKQRGNFGRDYYTVEHGIQNDVALRPAEAKEDLGGKPTQDVEKAIQVKGEVNEDTPVPSMKDMAGGTGQFGNEMEAGVGEELEKVGDEEKSDPPRRSENCMQCRMEQSLSDGEEPPVLEDDPGFRQYPTFISPRKSLVMCKHHAKQKNDTDISREQLLPAMTPLADAKSDQKSKPLPQSDKTQQILSLSREESDDKVAKPKEVKSPIGEVLRKISPVLNNVEGLSNITKSDIRRSESLKTSRERMINARRQVHSKTLPGPKGSHSPLLALSRDKKFAQNSKPTEKIRTALSLEWDDTGTELSPPNFSDDDEESGDLEDTRRPSVKLMNTNEALDKLKVIQSLIMKEAESRSRKESDESAGKCTVGVKRNGNRSAENTDDVGTTRTEAVNGTGTESSDFGRKYGGSKSTSNQVSPTVEFSGQRKVSSPTIWDRITDSSAISQDQTTELLNETLAKLKASPKLSSNVMAKRSLSSRSLPGSRQASKEQLLSDGERPVYVYTSSWMNRSGKNSRGSSLSLCSNNHSLPSSRQNLTKDLTFNGLKRSESAAGRMEKENGKRLEPKERKEFRLSDFDEINLSDDTSELRNQRTSTPRATPGTEASNERQMRKPKRRKKKGKNTAAKMNNLPAYGVSMEDLAEGKTKCHCGGGKCVIS
ncbi:uncharacterized protein LOC114520474 isoform X2 [Dendronephthya gigantea]|uniref:uncharacterized protein LOC114520474 isoform X2 n=1 Tax=Dendronephthya gigantea TaxID=151771 RepID=UPI0010697243|nr:uncharacterized protein LOC114520474 isoform X2 [Dendronephthya gigantea]